MQNGLERCCKALILKVLPIEGKKHIEGKGQLQIIGQRKGQYTRCGIVGYKWWKGEEDG